MILSLREKTDPSVAEDPKKITSLARVEAQYSQSYIANYRSKPSFSDAKMTVVISIKFEGDGVDVRDDYCVDLAKMAKLLQENPKLIVVMDVNIAAGSSASKVEVARLRLKHIMDYLAANFGVSYSRFYIAQLVRPPTCGDFFQKFTGSHNNVTVTLKYPSLIG